MLFRDIRNNRRKINESDRRYRMRKDRTSKQKYIRESSEVTVSDLIEYFQGIIDELENEYSENDIVHISPNTYRMETPMSYYGEGYIDLNNLNNHIEVVDEDDDE